MPTITSHPRLLLRLAAIAAASALTIAVGLLAVAPAAAHDALVSSDPAAGSSLEALPVQLTLVFTGELTPEPGATEIAVTDAEGTSLLDGAPVVEGTTLTQPLAGAASGAVTVLWKVVSGDGHPISGELSFTVAGIPDPVATATPTPSASTTEAGEPTPTPAPTTAPAEADSSPVPWIVLGVIAVAIIATLGYLLSAGGRRNRASSTDSTPSAER